MANKRTTTLMLGSGNLLELNIPNLVITTLCDPDLNIMDGMRGFLYAPMLLSLSVCYN